MVPYFSATSSCVRAMWRGPEKTAAFRPPMLEKPHGKIRRQATDSECFPGAGSLCGSFAARLRTACAGPRPITSCNAGEEKQAMPSAHCSDSARRAGNPMFVQRRRDAGMNRAIGLSSGRAAGKRLARGDDAARTSSRRRARRCRRRSICGRTGRGGNRLLTAASGLRIAEGDGLVPPIDRCAATGAPRDLEQRFVESHLFGTASGSFVDKEIDYVEERHCKINSVLRSFSQLWPSGPDLIILPWQNPHLAKDSAR